jgi:hypothetical protein
MQAIKEVISYLITGGMDAAEAAALVAMAIAEGTPRKRSAGAERASRYRERKALQNVTNRNALTPIPDRTKRDESVTNRDNATPAISSLDSIIKKENKKKNSGHALCDDWKPADDDYGYGNNLGLSRAQVDGFAEDMRLWARANANRAIGRKADWQATFRGWMRRESPKATKQHTFSEKMQSGYGDTWQ